MVRVYNTLGKRIETFRPVNSEVVTIFTCGPSVYQRAHIGNFRTFLFEDVLARYLEYSGYAVRRGMNLTDIEDKALIEAEKRKLSVKTLTEKNIKEFMKETKLLRMKMPDYLPKASESIDEAVEIIEHLLERRSAYWHDGNVYFEPLKFPGFGKLYGLDMSRWPLRRRRFHKDTYPGMRWNLGDFILWHGYKKGDKYYRDTRIGRGRPSWNIQDPGMISKYFDETLSVYCGGIDNLFRHHDYTLAILESIRPYPMARFWLHCNHLLIDGQKMSKSRGNIYYTDTLRRQGYDMAEIRFFLIYGHYRERVNYSDKQMRLTVNKLRTFKRVVDKIKKRAAEIIRPRPPFLKGPACRPSGRGWEDYKIKKIFIEKMNNDLNVKETFDGLYETISDIRTHMLIPSEASAIIKTLKEIDGVFKVIF